MIELHRLLARVSLSDLSVLILGETGVGKEIVAESIHLRSARARGPFLRLNCGAIASSLLESELFGHERGAFTGAVREKVGLFESAQGGTVFLDEIGDMPLDLQVKLLRVLEDRAVQRIGALRPRPIDVRFIAATHRDLRTRIAAGSFREDLYFRLNGFSAIVPPLRERPADIEPLARYFASQGGRTVAFTSEALALLQHYRWPGNVRELRNVVERGVLLADGGPFAVECLPPEIVAPAASEPLRVDATPANAPGSDRRAVIEAELESLERDRILAALERNGGNQTRAAIELGMPRRTLVRWLSEHGIRRNRPRSTE